MGQKPNAKQKAAHALAEAYKPPAAFDAEEDKLVAEFKDLDLTELEQSDLADVLRLRLGSKADQLAGRAVLMRLRQSLAEATRSTLAHSEDSGHSVAAMPKGDAIRVIDRDGLGQLLDKGKISERDHSGGMAYRKRYEAAFKGLRSTLGVQASGVPCEVDEMVASRTRLARYEIDRVRIEQRVIQECGELALSLLRAVAGEGRALATQSTKVERHRSGRAYDRATMLLRRALVICAERLPQD